MVRVEADHTYGEEPTGVDVLVIGGGPAGLMAAERAISTAPWCTVRVVDAQRSPGRKFLLAGRGGLNLTKDEPMAELLTRFSGTAAAYVRQCVSQCGPRDLSEWAAGMGEPTFVGSSGRVFPVSMRATPLLRVWLNRLDSLGVDVTTEWRADIASALIIRSAEESQGSDPLQHISIPLEGVGRRAGTRQVINARSVVLALGGASWPRTGSDGMWLSAFESADIATEKLGASNVGVQVDWTGVFLERHEGEPIKNVAVTCDSRTIVGDLVITRNGIEGGPIYALSPQLRRGATLIVNLRPDVDITVTEQALMKARAGDSLSNRLRKAGLSRSAGGLAVECGARDVADKPGELAALVHAMVVRARGVGSIERAISTSGGVSGASIDASGMLRSRPGVFIAGEMLDWEAPTGGYLLQGCWSTGCRAGTAAAGYGTT